MLIYKVTFPNKKSYIGLTVKTLKQRIASHLKSLRKGRINLFYTAIRKYGWDNLKWEILEDNITNFEILKEREKFNILKYDTFMRGGYNMTLGGDGSFGCHPSEETREKLRIISSGRKYPERARQMLGKKNSEHSKRMTGRKWTEEHCNNLSEALKGREFSKEHKQNLKEAWILRKQRSDNVSHAYR